MLLILINLCLNYGITCRVRGKSFGRWVGANFPVHIEHCTWSVAVPTCTLGAAVLNCWIGTSLANYIFLAPESATPVSWALCCLGWVILATRRVNTKILFVENYL